MPGPWNDATDRQLLLIIISLTSPALPRWDQVAEMMGDGFTAEAVRQHFQKLRKATEKTLGGISLGNKTLGNKNTNTARPKGNSKRKQATAEPERSESTAQEDKKLPKKVKLEAEDSSDEA